MKNEKRQGKKLFLPICVTRSNTLRNYFQGLKIYFQGLVIYFQGLIIYFQALKIISKHALRQKYLSQAELANMVRGCLPTAKNYTKHKEPAKTCYDAFSQAPCSNVNHLLSNCSVIMRKPVIAFKTMVMASTLSSIAIGKYAVFAFITPALRGTNLMSFKPRLVLSSFISST